MILVFDSTLLNAKTVNSVLVKTKKHTNLEHVDIKLTDPSTWFAAPKMTETTTYVLTIDYITENGGNWTFTSEHNDINNANARAKEVLKQIKEQSDLSNKEYVDKLFENALKEAP
jgi:hypothetical protein